MTREQAEAMARKFLTQHVHTREYEGTVKRLADAFEAAYDDGVRDESLRWAAGQKRGPVWPVKEMTRQEFEARFEVNPLPIATGPIDWAFVPPVETWKKGKP